MTMQTERIRFTLFMLLDALTSHTRFFFFTVENSLFNFFNISTYQALECLFYIKYRSRESPSFFLFIDLVIILLIYFSQREDACNSREVFSRIL